MVILGVTILLKSTSVNFLQLSNTPCILVSDDKFIWLILAVFKLLQDEKKDWILVVLLKSAPDKSTVSKEE